MRARSLICIYKSLRESGYRRGYATLAPTQFLQSKSQQMPNHGSSERRSFGATGSDPMKPTLLLGDETETTRLMLKDVASNEVPLRDTDAHAGCNCDRWGQPCPGCGYPHTV